MPFSDVFGGGVTQPADVSYRAVALSVDTTLVWPTLSVTSTDVAARIMNVTPTTSGLSIIMPSATQVSTGQDALIRNLGASTFTVKDNAGGTIGTVASGESKYIYLTNNSTAAGSWSIVTFGTGTSSADAATLAGAGLVAISTTLNQQCEILEYTTAQTVDPTQRAKLLTWTSGTVAATLPTANSMTSGFFVLVKNAGSGTVTLTRSGSDTIDGSTTKALAPGDGCLVFPSQSTDAWYTVGFGQSVNFAFTQLVKNVAGSSNVTLTSAECANKIMSFTGLLTGNIEVYVTNTASVYYVYNNTTGAYTLTVKTVAGSGISVTQGTRDILVCDATNVNRGVDNVSATTLFSAGSAGSPSIAFTGDADTGIYHPGANQVAVTAGGLDSMRFNTAASAVNAIDVFPAATGVPPSLRAYGTDSDVGLQLRPKGTGLVQMTDGADVTKIGAFDLSALTTATTRTYELPDNSGTVDVFPAGTRLVFQQTAAPTGWTKDTTATYNDSALRFVTGAASTGGATAFTTVFGASVNTGSYTLLEADIPGHTHTGPSHTHTGTTASDGTHTHSTAGVTYATDGGADPAAIQGYGTGTSANVGTNLSAQANGAHTHTFTSDAAGTGATGSTGGGGGHLHSMSMNIKYTDCIIATKN